MAPRHACWGGGRRRAACRDPAGLGWSVRSHFQAEPAACQAHGSTHLLVLGAAHGSCPRHIAAAQGQRQLCPAVWQSLLAAAACTTWSVPRGGCPGRGMPTPSAHGARAAPRSLTLGARSVSAKGSAPRWCSDALDCRAKMQIRSGGLALPQPVLLAPCQVSYLIQTLHYMHFSENKPWLDTARDCFFRAMRRGSVPSSTDKVPDDRGISIQHINLQLILWNQYFSLRTCESWPIIGKNLFRLTP